MTIFHKFEMVPANRIRALILSVAVATTLLVLNVTQADDSKTNRPNIVLILADDMGYDAVSFNNKAMGPLKTPCIDRLCTQGMVFTDAHSASSVCTPTRYGLLTGRYCWRTELKKEVLWDYGRPLIEDERLTVAELLKQHGYATAMFGKWHLGLNWYGADGTLANDKIQIADASFRKANGSAARVKACEEAIDWTKPVTGGPTDHGFDTYFGVDVPNFPPYSWIENDKLTAVPTVPKPKNMFGSIGPMVPGWKLEEILPTFTERAAQWIAEQAAKDKPFFVYLPLTSPHTPIAPSAPFQGKSNITAFADFLMETDAVVGRISDALDKAGIADNTLFIFTTDNGTAHACNFAQLKKHGVDLRHTFSGQKATIQEGGHRVPFIVRWPGQTKAGSTCHEIICLNDFIATVADLLDAPLPADAGEDSTSILPLITGAVQSLPNRPMLVHHDYRGNFAIRGGKWKLIAGNTPKLFDLETDPKEQNNLAAEHPDIVEHMAATLQTYKTNGHSRNGSADKAERILFEDNFDAEKLGAGWRWLREDAQAWRLKDKALEIRVQPGKRHNVKNALLRSAPDRSKGAYAIEVTVTNKSKPTHQYEQAGIVWYQNGKPGVKLVKELVDGKLMIIPGRAPMHSATVRLRLIVTADSWTAQYRADDKGAFKTAGTGKLPAPGKDEISLQCYEGPADAEHWIRFDDFRILKIAE